MKKIRIYGFITVVCMMIMAFLVGYDLCDSREIVEDVLWISFIYILCDSHEIVKDVLWISFIYIPPVLAGIFGTKYSMELNKNYKEKQDESLEKEEEA